jgi:hypothetical protein
MPGNPNSVHLCDLQEAAASLPSRYFPTVTRHATKDDVMVRTEAMGASALLAGSIPSHGLMGGHNDSCSFGLFFQTRVR